MDNSKSYYITTVNKTEENTMISQALKDCLTLQDVVNLINEDGTNQFDGSEIAGQYAFTCCDEAYCEYASCYESFDDYVDEESLCVHLNILRQNGAIFDLKKAVDHALSLKEPVV